ncbi:hypothetical protein [Aurantiacibacter sediminis]|uniref:Uncharacterized protein n=1 Tax=Aurantiacibacter sediminis TaxID=2793064 RepID=A0ABS0N3B1_9SPHN|nr:hypothetical protein [Aurantiacibacter sediminis]MBH5322455.1 hypothetical protein [Aurantiacibacter sediminis]
MALAHIRPDPAGGAPGTRSFIAELGASRYWRVAVGPEETRRTDGARLMAKPAHVSQVSGPVPPEARGRVRVTIPEEHFDRENGHVQLMTYRDANGTGPAFSPVVRSAPGLPDAMPALGFSARGVRSLPHTQPQTAALSWKQPTHVSYAMVLPAFLAPLLSAAGPLLAGALPKLATSVAPLAGQLLQSVLAGREAPQNADQTSQDRQALDAAIAALRALAGTGAQAPGANGAAANPPAQAQSMRNIRRRKARGASRSSAFAREGTARSHLASMQRRSLSLRQQLPVERSQAMVAPLAALLPMLTPLLGKVLTPETVQSVINMPNEHMKTIFNAMKEAGKLAIQSEEQELQHLRALTPSVDDPALDALLSSANVGFSLSKSENWQRAESVTLHMEPCRRVTLNGRPVCLMAADTAWSFPLSITLPTNSQGQYPTLKNATLRIVVKEKDTLRELLHKQQPLGPVAASGPLPALAQLDAADVRRLPQGVDLIVAFAVIWTNSEGKKRGAPLQHLVQIAGGPMFDRLQPSGELHRLDEESGFGDYVHDVWQNRFRDDAKRVVGELTYLCPFATGAPSHRRMKTEYRSDEVERTRQRRHLQLRSGFEISLDTLAELGRMLGAEPVTAQMRAALGSAAFAEAANRSARVAFDFRGAPQEVFRLRAVPTYDLARCYFRIPGAADAKGQITSMEEREARLPLPASLELEVHNDSTGAQIGMPVSSNFLAARLLRDSGGGGE